ncbi:MAG: hypothetical protein NE334_16260 [Lentisphaeraceae bacterium]|nr:hypothetical protein [Lentisphaeraceae bacterium]
MDPQETEEQMVSYVTYWSRLADIPKSATNFTITPNGSSFTRSYQGHFILEKNILEQWIKESPSLQGAKIELLDEGVKKL